MMGYVVSKAVYIYRFSTGHRTTLGHDCDRRYFRCIAVILQTALQLLLAE